jgi:RNA recognition motif-containing protein
MARRKLWKSERFWHQTAYHDCRCNTVTRYQNLREAITSDKSLDDQVIEQSLTKGRDIVKKLYVGNLAFSVTENDLREMMAPYGAVETVSLVTDRDTGRSRGFGFVEMTNDAEAAAAIAALNGKDSGGRPLTVNEARPKAERGRGGSRGSGDDYRGHARQPREPRW